MSLNFSPNEVRLLGCLIEKQLATPDYYPMTHNSLTLASNQKSSRDPVLSLSSDEVSDALSELARKEFVEQVKLTGSKAFKFMQRLDLRWGISDQNAETERDTLAVLAVLCLRGPQTIGQIRQRTERLFFFPGLEQVQSIIDQLMQGTEERPPLVTVDNSLPGRDTRYTHLLSGNPIESTGTVPEVTAYKTEEASDLEARVTELEAQVAQLMQLLKNEDA